MIDDADERRGGGREAFTRLVSVLTHPGVARTLGSCMVTRIPNAMAPFAIILTLRHSGASYGVAGVGAAAYSGALAVSAPVVGRRMDRIGARPVLVVAALVYAVALITACALVLAGAPIVAVLALLALGGASAPPVAAALRAAWVQLLPDRDQLEDAFGLESILQELTFAAAPVLASGVATTGQPELALGIGGVLALGGTVAFAHGLPLVVIDSATSRSRRRALANDAVRTVVVATFFTGAGFGFLEVGMPAFAEHVGRSRSAAGIPLAAYAVGSLIGGIVIGGRRFRLPAERRLSLGLGLMASGAAGLLLAEGLWSVTCLAFVAGLPSAPALSMTYQLVERRAFSGTTNEAFSWLATAVVGGIGTGSAAGGWLIEASGARAAWSATAGALFGAVVLTAIGLRGTKPVASPRGD